MSTPKLPDPDTEGWYSAKTHRPRNSRFVSVRYTFQGEISEEDHVRYNCYFGVFEMSSFAGPKQHHVTHWKPRSKPCNTIPWPPK